jgi:hypothetical protein
MRSRFRQEFLWSEKLGAGSALQVAYPEPDTTPSHIESCEPYFRFGQPMSPDKINLEDIVNLGNI